jgi:serine/threonine-protein kinase
MTLNNGDVFAGYTVVRLLGSGGMGEVYLARHPRLPRHDALKVLPAQLTADTDFRQRFEREADLAAGLWHPHIVGVHDRGEYGGQLWIAMDYVEGSDAALLLRDRYPAGMPEHEVSEIVIAVAEALDYAHERQLLHRDVKPANILLTKPASAHRRILLADFGIARQIDDVSGLTATNMTIGSVLYAPPEQLMGEPLDGRADQYALAASAFHLLTGAPPFSHTNPAVVISRHLNTTPPKLSDHRSDLAVFDAVMSAALAKNPADRFNTCQDFAMAFNQRLATEVGPQRETAAAIEIPGESDTGPTATGTASMVPRPWQRAVVLWVTPVAVVALIAGVILALSRTDGNATGPPNAATPASQTTPGVLYGPPSTTTTSTQPTTSASPNDGEEGRGNDGPVTSPASTVDPPPSSEPPATSVVAPTEPRLRDTTGTFSFIPPRDWESADASPLRYGSALLTTGANDTSIRLGRLDSKLPAGDVPDNTQAADQLCADMGQEFMPFPGTRTDIESSQLGAGDVSGAASYYRVEFEERGKPSGQIWCAAIGSGDTRWFVVWLGSSMHPVDKPAAVALAESIRP